MLRLVEAIAHASKAANEDLFDCNAEAAWIFDGASGIGPGVIAGAPSDPWWLVHAVNDALKANWRDDLATPDLCRAAMTDVAARFAEAAGSPPPDLADCPTACLLMARLWEGRLELSSVGDCWMLRAGADGVTEFGVKISDEVAAPVRDELARLTAAGVAGAELFERLVPLERAVRAKANIDGGYAIVDLTDRWTGRLARAEVEAAPGDTLLLMTDGFYRLIDTFGLYDAQTLMTAARRGGLAPLYDELRAVEQADAACVRFPRIKKSDDVAAALLVIE